MSWGSGPSGRAMDARPEGPDAESGSDPRDAREPGRPGSVRQPEPGPGAPALRRDAGRRPPPMAPGPADPGPELPQTPPEAAPEPPGLQPGPRGESAGFPQARRELDSEPAPGSPRHQPGLGPPEPPRPPPPGSPRGQREPSRPAPATRTGSSDLGAKKRTGPAAHAAASKKLKEVEAALVIPKGRPQSGRVWKDGSKKRFSQMVQSKPLRTSWQQKMKERQERKLAKDFARHLEEEKEKRQQEKKQRRAENLKRRLENERRAEVVQVIRNPAKLKRAKKKQLRSIQKRDTLALLQKQPSQQPAAKI